MDNDEAVSPWNSYSFMFGPVVALVGLGVLILVLRWAFSGRRSSAVAARARKGQPDNYGLLVAVGSPGTYVEGEIWRRQLEAAGIRANLAQTLAGPRVMVWPVDEERAREVLARS